MMDSHVRKNLKTVALQHNEIRWEQYRISGNFRVVKFSCFIMSCHNIFVDWVTHENFFTATSLTRGDEGLAARLPRLSGTLGSSCWPRTRE